LHGIVALGLSKRNKFFGVVNFFFERFPIGDSFFEIIQFFGNCLGLLVIGPEILILGIFI
jgi:hypothetical protein